MKLKFEGSYLKQEDKTAFTPKNVVNIFIVYELDAWPRDLNTDFTLGGGLFGGFKLTKNADPDKYSHSGYSSVGKNVIVFGVNVRSSVHMDNKGNNISILGRGLKDTRVQGYKD